MPLEKHEKAGAIVSVVFFVLAVVMFWYAVEEHELEDMWMAVFLPLAVAAAALLYSFRRKQ